MRQVTKENVGLKLASILSLTGVLLICPAVARPTAECPLGPLLKESETLVGYLRAPERISERTGSFNALMILENGVIRSTNGSAIQDGMRFWLPLAPDQVPVRLRAVSGYLERLGPDHCVYHAEVEREIQDWALVSSRPLHSLLRAPTALDKTDFFRLNTQCVNQGDPPPGETPTCERPRLMAVSDLDADGKTEYWYTQPYLWDTGFTVAEETGTGELSVVVSACPGCSD